MRSEKGQAIVFLALGFVVFLGFVGLAIDGGMLYADRRNAQSSSDASSLAGAGISALELANKSNAYTEVRYGQDWDCGSVLIENAEWLGRAEAVERSASNGFSITNLITDTQYLTGTVWSTSFVSSHCEDADNGSYFEQYIDITVNISDTTETSFAQVLYPQPLHNVVSATARIYPKEPFGLGNALVALRDWCGNDQEGGAHFGGSNNVYINGGGVFSNACIEANGAPGNPADPNQVIIDNGEVTYLTNYNASGDPMVSPSPSAGNPNRPIVLDLDEPSCTGMNVYPKVRVGNADTIEIFPGIYPEITVQGGTLHMNPGLYCILTPASPSDGDGNVLFNGGTIEGPTGYDGTTNPWESGVSFFLDQGDFSTSGSPTVRLTAALPGSCTTVPCPGINEDMEAILIFLAHDSPGDVTLTGTGDDVFTGMVYVPSGTVNLVGTGSNVSFNLQIFADTIDISGNAVLNINYNEELLRWTDVTIELAK